MSAVEGASEASSPEQANERTVQANERTDERVAQYLGLYSGLFQTTVRQPNEPALGRFKGKLGKPDIDGFRLLTSIKSRQVKE